MLTWLLEEDQGLLGKQRDGSGQEVGEVVIQINEVAIEQTMSSQDEGRLNGVQLCSPTS